MSTNLGPLYALTRDRVLGTVRDLPADRLARTVPACPDWTVRELLAHLAGNAAAWRDGVRHAGPPSPTWTAAQVAARRDATLADILAEWEAAAPAVESLDTTWSENGRLLYDLVIHDDDLRETLDLAPADWSPAQDLLFGQLRGRTDYRLRRHGAGSLTVTADGDTWELGEGEPAAAVTAPSRRELFRALCGRRRLSELRSWPGAEPPAAWVDHMPLFPPPAEAQ